MLIQVDFLQISALIRCFLDSKVEPKVQVDVTGEVARSIIARSLGSIDSIPNVSCADHCGTGENAAAPSPYLFRVAEVAVFGVLFNYYPGFCRFRLEKAQQALCTPKSKVNMCACLPCARCLT